MKSSMGPSSSQTAAAPGEVPPGIRDYSRHISLHETARPILLLGRRGGRSATLHFESGNGKTASIPTTRLETRTGFNSL